MDTLIIIASVTASILLLLAGCLIRYCCLLRYRKSNLARLHKEAEAKRLASLREADDIFDMSDDEEEIELVRRVTPTRAHRREGYDLEADSPVDTTLMRSSG